MTRADDELLDSTDTALAEWRQGDCVLGEQWFAHRRDAPSQQTSGRDEIDQIEPSLTESEVLGFAVVTQSCDIVRRWYKRPYVQVAPLVQFDASELQSIKQGRRPQYAFIGGVSDRNLVADLDRVMTVEKSVVAKWQRTVGCRSETEVRRFANAIVRKGTRFAFPTDFTTFAKKLVARLQEKHDRLSQEGKALQELEEIRVSASPSWDANQVQLTFWFIRGQSLTSSPKQVEMLTAWEKLVPAGGRFKQISCTIVDLEDMTARDYVESYPLDLDHLTSQ